MTRLVIFIFFLYCCCHHRDLHFSLHDALPICRLFYTGHRARAELRRDKERSRARQWRARDRSLSRRSEEHTSELQSRPHLVCRLLLEKKKNSEKYSVSSKDKQRYRSYVHMLQT